MYHTPTVYCNKQWNSHETHLLTLVALSSAWKRQKVCNGLFGYVSAAVQHQFQSKRTDDSRNVVTKATKPFIYNACELRVAKNYLSKN